jgi:hypothetical protein
MKSRRRHKGETISVRITNWNSATFQRLWSFPQRPESLATISKSWRQRLESKYILRMQDTERGCQEIEMDKSEPL